MKLLISERLTLLEILPPVGDSATLRIVRDLQSSLSPSEAEHKKLKIETAVRDGHMSWKWEPKFDRPISIDMGDVAFKLILDQFEKLDKEKKLTLPRLALYEKFQAVKQNAK